MKRPHQILLIGTTVAKASSICQTFQRAGHEVKTARSAAAALKLANLPDIDLIILEHKRKQTPNPAYKEIRNQLPDHPVVIITASHLLTNDELLRILPPSETPEAVLSNAIELIVRSETDKSHSAASTDADRRMRDYTDNTHDIMYMHDLEGHYTYLNKRGCELTGYAPDEATTIDSAQVASPEHMELAKRMLQLKIARGTSEPTVYEIDLRCKDGRTLPVEISSQLIFKDGKPVAVLGIARDITERRRSEAALRLANETLKEANERNEKQSHELSRRLSHLAQILAAARDTSLVFHTIAEYIKENVPCETIVHATYDQDTNEALPQFLWTEEEGIQNLVDSNPIELQNGPAGLAVLRREIVLSNNISAAVIHDRKLSLNPHQNGHKPLLSIMTVPMCIGQTVIGLLELQTAEAGCYTDEQKTPIATAANLAANAIESIRLINRDRERQQQLYQAQRIESVGRLAAHVAHDFNNTITAILGNSDLAKNALPIEHPARHRLLLIDDSCQRAKYTAGKILSFSRKRKLERQNHDLNKLIADVISKIQEYFVGEDILFDTNFDDTLPLAHIDAHQMEQILINLIVNAKDAMPAGGTITFTTLRLKPGHPRHSNTSDLPELLLTVTDTGTGMDAETQKNVFTEFFTTKEEGRGTGLGLSMARGSIEQHGGTISVSSTLGKGTTFYIQLPPADGQTHNLKPRITKTRHHLKSRSNTETILVAEDSEAVRKTTVDMLRNHGFTVVQARDGVEALDLIKETPDLIDLLLTDLLMPRMNGRDLARHAQDLSPRLKVLYMSSFNNDYFTEQSEAEATFAFLEKPFTNSQLIETINHALR